MTAELQQESERSGKVDNVRAERAAPTHVDAAAVQPAPAGGIFSGLKKPEETPGQNERKVIELQVRNPPITGH